MKINVSMPPQDKEFNLTTDNLLDAARVFCHGDIQVEPDTKHIIAFAMMKSGSSFIVNALSQVLSYRLEEYSKKFIPNEYWKKLGIQDDLSLCGFFNGNHTPELPLLLMSSFKHNTVSQQHAIADAPTLWALKSFANVHPVVLQRNLLDALLSMHDDIMKEADRSERAWGTDKMMWGTHIFHYQSPQVWDRFFNLPFEERIDELITFSAPWYFSFLASWRKAAELNVISPLFLRYEDLPGNEEWFIRQILEFSGHAVSSEELSHGISRARGDRERSRINVGVNGRGKEKLSKQQIDRVCRIGKFIADDDIIQEFVLNDYRDNR